MRCGGLDSAMTIQRAADRHLISLIPKVCETDLEVAELERQVCELRAKVTAQLLAKRSKVNGENFAKEARETSSSEKTEPSRKNETNKIASDVSRLQREYISTMFCVSFS